MAVTALQHLTTIDLLRARAFPAQRGRSASVVSGPGYHMAELATSEEFWEDDGTARLAVEEQYEADCRALGTALSARWGEPQPVSLWSTQVRSIEGGEAEQPWLDLSASAPWLELWRTGELWIALGVCRQGDELPFQLVAVVTVNDPP